MTSTTERLVARHPSATPRTAEQIASILADPGFGRVFTDHMVTATWVEDRGWHDAQLVPYGPIAMDPASQVLHYAQEIFEGLKAYRQADGGVALFRPEMNARRFNRSAHRLAMPELPEELFLASIEALVTEDVAYVPGAREQALYLRPFMLATEVGLGVRPANQYLFAVIASPAAAYFPQGIKPVTVWLSQEYVRAVPGGTGEAKCGGNYAASLRAQLEAAEQGCDQVVWLDGVERRWVEEMGGMNLCFVYGSGADARIMTPELSGALLPGVTRDSLLTLAKDLGYVAEEGRISTADWRAASESGELTEVFACGTAAVITPVGAVKSAEGSWTIGDGSPGPVTTQLRDALLDLQTGAAPDPHGWRREIVLP